MSDLKKISENKGDILLAEIGALLHDMGKCVDAHITAQALDCPENFSYRYRRLQDIRGEIKMPNLLSSAPQLQILGEQVSINQFVERSGSQWWIKTLRRCHGAAHVEKEETDESGKQSYTDTRLSSPFGIEGDHVSGLTDRLKQLPWANIQQRKRFLKELRSAFEQALGDTRRPENEVTLWDWSLIVAALYKAALAGAVLGYKPDPNKLRWRLLSVRFDGLGFLSEAHRIPDLLGRKEALEDALDAVKELLEVKYPLGTEVYRDENGSLFVVPGCERGDCTLDLLKLKDGDKDGKSLQKLLEEKFQEELQGEIIPHLKVDPEPWWGQDPEWRSKSNRGITVFNDELPPVAEHLKPVETGADPELLEGRWGDQRAEVCTVCGLRPQVTGAEGRHLCAVCLERSRGRVQQWLRDLQDDLQKSLKTTVWVNEVADNSARLALIVGRFNMTHWLDGTLVRTLRVTDPASPTRLKYVTEKIPSFVRLHRIWTTTRRFWQEICPTDPELDPGSSLIGEIIKAARPRLVLEGEFQPLHRAGGGAELQRHLAYELVLERGVTLSVVWDGQRFLTCDNLAYLESDRQLGRPLRKVLVPNATFPVEHPVGYELRRRTQPPRIGNFRVTRVIEDRRYTPAIPILAEPQTFMALVPANRAMDVVKGIKAKYEREMGKVRNRLPLHLGVVFAHRRTPLRAILDAGRRLLQNPGLPSTGWLVAHTEDGSQRSGDSHFAKSLILTLKLADREAIWRVPLRMGDSKTEDVWYPYVFRHGPEPLEAKRRFLAPNPYERDTQGNPRKVWLVHAEDLRPGDAVYFAPATLDWVWLDTNARRFELAYDDGGQRLSPRQRPYLLDELDILEGIWRTLETHLHRHQIHILRETIEAKRAAWGFPSPYDETFRRFCRDLLAEAEWHSNGGKMPWESEGLDREEWLKRWADYAARGWLSDAVELYWEILKAGEGGNESEEEEETVKAEEGAR